MILDYFVELDSGTTQPKEIDEFTLRYHRLIADEQKKDADALRAQWGKTALSLSLPEPTGNLWQIIARPDINLTLLPSYSFWLRFTFTLTKPYISKDENAFYIIDNPIVRDKVFRLPMVRPTSWKGNLYSALWQLGHDKGEDAMMKRLFGEAHGEETGQAGRLLFYPTFFTQTGLEIVNPHDRKRRVGKNPILFECVPIGAKGTFSLLYVPFDLIGRPEKQIRTQAAEDLQRVAEGLQAMFLTYGFSAKRTSGYGVAKEAVSNGVLTVRVEESLLPPEPPVGSAGTQALSLPKYLVAPGKLKPQYLNPDGTFRERSEAELKAMKKSDRQEYEKARKWWEREGKALASQPPAEPEPAPPQWPMREFGSFEELVQKAQEVANLLQAGGEQ